MLGSDGEAALKAVADDVASFRASVRTITEEAFRGASGSNGIVKTNVESVTHQTRGLNCWLEAKWVREPKTAKDGGICGGVIGLICRVTGSLRIATSREGMERYRVYIAEHSCDDLEITAAQPDVKADFTVGGGGVCRDAYG